MPSGRRGGRHRAPQAPSAASRILRTTGAVTAIVGSGLAVSTVAAAPAGAATADDFSKLRQCESGGNYSINTGNGFYGAYQFDPQTWHGLGYSGLPHQAAPATQDAAAAKLYNSRGWSPWPSCSRKMGLVNNGPASVGSGGDVIEQAITPAEPPMTLDRARQEMGDNSYKGTVLSAQYGDDVRPDAFVWQAAMRNKGFVLTVDGKFGPQSQGIAALYGYLTRVDDGQPGAVGQSLWNASVRS
ncbi:Transglycosylase-like protein [Frankia canadensis]|uniref:Transglycosylase-like protein n=1 Tax=Frankia canadensis TaxID=1836972 RepID=A0A2I2KKU2_9ACTN|nr:transglycosylase family protein [Frankia canadensis]SNQ46288.1 Transglycosylase-like protein [Frankia canadensis]SOU53578.1 Transglycosylase-like protein [Frankia canadensis]